MYTTVRNKIGQKGGYYETEGTKTHSVTNDRRNNVYNSNAGVLSDGTKLVCISVCGEIFADSGITINDSNDFKLRWDIGSNEIYDNDDYNRILCRSV